ncbi:MAG: hypothetical protein CVU11_09620 [Bacteroidetes bacterium HGW-Bacteroidetes-6]|jgi:hypothetical protein|nr:MAG: hypothetical protein CVU11_09620 [Bacteroidetes bacterium HGW-Bacteroidetes-6]
MMKKTLLLFSMNMARLMRFRRIGIRLGLLLLAATPLTYSCSGTQTKCYEAADPPGDTVEHTRYKAYNPDDTVSRTDTINMENEK